MNTGAEAVETALKAARRYAYRKKGIPADQAEIIVCEGNFHGRTITVTSFSSSREYREDFGPFTPGFKVIPYGDLEALEQAISPNTAAFLVEPIQGESGIVIPPDGYLSGALGCAGSTTSSCLRTKSRPASAGRANALPATGRTSSRICTFSEKRWAAASFRLCRGGGRGYSGCIRAGFPRLHLRRKSARLRGGHRLHGRVH